MIILSYVVFASIFAWFMPPFRQTKTQYFYFFYVLALIDPAALLNYYILHIPINIHLILGACAGIASLVTFSTNRRKYLLRSFLLTVLSMSIKFILPDYTNILVVFLLSVLFLLILKATLKYTASTNSINIFQLVLLVYMGANIIKYELFSSDAMESMPFMLVTNVIQIFIAVFFTVFREDSKGMQIRIATLQENGDKTG